MIKPSPTTTVPGKLMVRRKTVKVEAVQWFVVGDHPAVYEYEKSGQCYIDDPAEGTLCMMKVTPGDWVITLPSGGYFVCPPDRFEAIYERAE